MIFRRIGNLVLVTIIGGLLVVIAKIARGQQKSKQIQLRLRKRRDSHII